MASSTFNALKKYWYPTEKDPYLDFSLPKIVQLAQTNEAFRTRKLAIKWIKDYCEHKKISLMLPMQSHKTIQALALGLAVTDDEKTKEQMTDKDLIACAALYLTEILDGIHNMVLALEIKQEIKTMLHAGVNTQSSVDVLESNWDLYFTNLTAAAGKENFYALYLLLYEELSSKLKNKSLEESMEKIRTIEQNNFKWMVTFYGGASQLYIAELYSVFALTLFDKILLEKKKNLECTVFLNKINDTRRYHSFLNECHMLIVECIVHARAALNQFEQERSLLDIYTKNSMKYFTENMTGFNPEDTVMKLRMGLTELDSKNNAHTRPINTPSFMLDSTIVIDVNPATLPWSNQLVTKKMNANTSDEQTSSVSIKTEEKPATPASPKQQQTPGLDLTQQIKAKAREINERRNKMPF